MNTTNGSAMSVEINDCIFRKNTALFGTIGNIGGFVSVYKTLFDENFAMVSQSSPQLTPTQLIVPSHTILCHIQAGDIVSTNGGDNKM